MAHRLIAFLAAAIAAVAFNVGCASSAGSLGEGASASEGVMASARLMRQGQAEIEQVVASIDALQSQQGATIPELFEKFEDSVDAMDKTANRVGATNRKMQDRAANYFETWSDEIATITNESIRARSADRQEEIQKGMNNLKKKFEKLSTDYAKFLGNLNDIRTALALDLNPEGIDAVKSPMNKAKKQARTIEKTAGAVADTYEKLGVRMSALQPEQGS